MGDILIVEDDNLISAGMQRTLESAGHRVRGVATTGEDAVRLAEMLHPDIALMDILLHGKMCGIEAATRIDRDFDIGVVFVTANSDDATVRDAAAVRPLGLVVKPFHERELRAEVECALVQMKERRDRNHEKQWWWALALRSIGDGVIAVDEADNVVFMNVAAEKLTGCQEERVLGQPVDEVLRIRADGTRGRTRAVIKKAILKRAPEQIVSGTRLVARNQDVRICGNVAPMIDLDNRVIGSIIVFREMAD